MVERNREYWCLWIDLEKVYKEEHNLKHILSFGTTAGIFFKKGFGGEHHLDYAYACFQETKSFIDKDPQVLKFANNLNSVAYNILHNQCTLMGGHVK